MIHDEKRGLDVPLFIQEKPYECVPTCIKMVIDYLNRNKLNQLIPEMSVDEIADKIQTREDGTRFSNVPLINEHIVEAVPSVEFIAEYRPHTLKDIQESIDNGLPCIPWIVIKPDGINETVHAVVITGINIEANTIYYNDPYFGKHDETLGTFEEKWGKADKIMIKVLLGRKERKVLTEWIDREDTEEKRQ